MLNMSKRSRADLVYKHPGHSSALLMRLLIGCAYFIDYTDQRIPPGDKRGKCRVTSPSHLANKRAAGGNLLLLGRWLSPLRQSQTVPGNGSAAIPNGRGAGL